MLNNVFIISYLFLFSKTQSKEFTNSLATKSHHYDPQAPDTWESQNTCKKAAEGEESGPGPRPAPPFKEEKISVSLSYL